MGVTYTSDSAVTYTPIATQTLSGGSSVTFSSIPQTYTDLVIVFNGANAAAVADLAMQFNGDTGSYYSSTRLVGYGSGRYTDRYTNMNNIVFSVGSPGTDNSTTIGYINNYSSPSTYKTALIRTNNTSYGAAAVIGLWRWQDAITSISISISGTTFTSGSTFTIYGIKAA